MDVNLNVMLFVVVVNVVLVVVVVAIVAVVVVAGSRLNFEDFWPECCNPLEQNLRLLQFASFV